MSELLALIQKPWRIQRLKRRYCQLSFQAPEQAKKSLQRQIAILKSKRPIRKNGTWRKSYMIYKRIAGNDGRQYE